MDWKRWLGMEEEGDEESDVGTDDSSQAFESKFDFDESKEESKDLLEMYEVYAHIINLDMKPREIQSLLLKISAGFTLFIFIISTIYAVIVKSFLTNYFFFVLASAYTSFTMTYLILNLLLMIYFDVTIRKRTKQIEDALPDFLQITSANISAGMPIDRALWFAVRPKFGALAEEMERAAKRVMAGEELESALEKMSAKYDSQVLEETVSLLVEGINSGGEMAGLLNKISENISENKIMRKEIKANVTTYAIFIGAASVVAAPILLALSTQLLRVIQDITQNVDLDTGGGGAGGMSFFSFDFSGDSISIFHFEVFSMVMLGITAFFSAAIISSIRKGNIKDGFKMIPVFVIISLAIYWIGNTLFNSIMGSII